MSQQINVGIDLGTTYSSLIYYNTQFQRKEILKFNGSLEAIASTLHFNRNGKAIVGDKVDNCFSEVKRFIGLHYSDPEVQRDKDMYPFKIVQGPNDSIILKLEENDREYSLTPEEVTALLLIYLRKQLEQQVLGGRKYIINTVVTVPSNFKDAQIKATERAIKMAGFNLIQTEREPTAAAFAYQCDKKMRSGKILVFDFGGGTLDLSIIDTRNGVFDVQIPHGDNHFGGIDVDTILKDEILDLLLEEDEEAYERIFGPNVAPKVRETRNVKLRRNTEKMKIDLCTKDEDYELNFGFISSEFEDVELIISRDLFDEWNDVIYKQSIRLVEECLKNNNLDRNDIDKVLLVGGSSKIPGLREELRNMFGDKIDNESVDPNLAIAIGAFHLVQNRMEKREGIVLPTERTCHPIQMKSTVNGIVELVKIVPEGTLIPFTVKKDAKTSRNKQKTVEVEVFENGQLLDKFKVDNLPMKRAGVCHFDVIFSMSSNKKLTVSAELTRPTGFQCKNSMTITPSVRDLDQEELVRRGEQLMATYF